MKLLKWFGGSDDSSKKNKEREFDEEKHLDLLDDDYFAVDNGIDKLEIFELGITETKDPARSLATAPLQDKVHLKSEISESEALELKKAKAEAIFAEIERQEEINRSYEESERKTKKKNIVYDYDLDETEYEDTEKTEAKEVVEEVKKPTVDPKNTSADAVFASDFDPFKLVMSEEMANKPSSKSIPTAPEAKVSRSYSNPLAGDVSDITEEDILRARRQEEFERKKEERLKEFERRKAELVSRAAANAAVASKEQENACEIEVASAPAQASAESAAIAEQTVSEQPAAEQSATEAAVAVEQKAGRTYFNPMYTSAPVQNEVATGSQEVKTPYSRAAAFSALTMNDEKKESAPTEASAKREEPEVAEQKENTTPARPIACTFEIIENEQQAEEFTFSGEVDETEVPAVEAERVVEAKPVAEAEPVAEEDNTLAAEEKAEAPAAEEFSPEESANEPYIDAEDESAPIALFDSLKETSPAPEQIIEREENAESSAEVAAAAEESEELPRPVIDEHYETLNDAGIPIIDRGVPLHEMYGEKKAEPTESAEKNTAEYTAESRSEVEAPAVQTFHGSEEASASAEEGGLVFEFDSMQPVKPQNGGPRILVTERVIYDSEEESSVEEDEAEVFREQETAQEQAEDEGESPDSFTEDEGESPDSFTEDEVKDAEEGWCEREIPPEEQNPEVAEMRDMFTALRQKDDDDGDEEIEDTAEEDTPYIDTFFTDPDGEEYEEEEYVAEAEYVEMPADDTEEDETPPFDIPQPKKKEEPAVPEKKKPDFSNYKKPPIDLLGLDRELDDEEINAEIQENIRIIIETLASFNVTASIKGVDRGPRITRYEVVPARGVKVQQITHLFDDITLNLAVEGIRMEAPIPGKSAIGIEIPNKHSANVRLRELLECDEFVNAKSTTFVCIGKDVAGNPVFGDIAKFPHALVAGATGMGKSVSINSIMISMLYKSRPDQVKFIMIDPKKVEFRMYSGIPHLLIPVITEAKQAAGALMWAVEEMERRYDLIEKMNIRNIEAYNERQAEDPSIGEHMPKIIIVIDELNDLMMQVRDPVEDLIMRIAQKARAAGIHLIIGTQRPDVKVITGTIKANINTRISCKVTSVVDSRTILEMAGAEKLLNRGDMLFKPVDKTKPIRVQGAFVSDSEVENIMNFLKEQMNGEQYDEEIFAEINKAAQKCGNKKSGGASADDLGADDEDDCGYYGDQKFLDAVELAIRSGKISTALLQRKLSIGYGRAAKYIDHMEEIGVVSEPNGSKAREVYLTMDEWREKLSRVNCE